MDPMEEPLNKDSLFLQSFHPSQNSTALWATSNVHPDMSTTHNSQIQGHGQHASQPGSSSRRSSTNTNKQHDDGASSSSNMFYHNSSNASTAAPAMSPTNTTTTTTTTDASPPNLGGSSNATWKPDRFVLTQGYQTYHKELHDLIFNAAQQQSPLVGVMDEDDDILGGQHQQQQEDVEMADQHQQQQQQLPSLTPNLPSSSTDDQGSEATRKETAKILATGKRVIYLRNYITRIAPWLDMFDTNRAFGLRLPALARQHSSPALLYAILGISARQVERKEGRKNQFESLELYGDAISHLAPLMEQRDPVVIPVCVILCCLEMMSASAQDWRRHLEGCATLFRNFGIHGFSDGLMQAVFWCYARMDLCGALISDGLESTLIPPDKWLPPNSPPSQAREHFTSNSTSSDANSSYANYSVYLGARACELVSERTKFVEMGITTTTTSGGNGNGNNPSPPCTGQAFTSRWVALWEELQLWVTDCPMEFHPIKAVETNPFPHILYPHWAAISSTQLHHTSCILLLGILPKSPSPGLNLGAPGSAKWHAKRICGISLANEHQGSLNNAIHPIWIAGRLLSHRSEHDLIIRIIWSIETLTGWGTSWRISDLEWAWGYKA